jgi:hypothetical protein
MIVPHQDPLSLSQSALHPLPVVPKTWTSWRPSRRANTISNNIFSRHVGFHVISHRCKGTSHDAVLPTALAGIHCCVLRYRRLVRSTAWRVHDVGLKSNLCSLILCGSATTPCVPMPPRLFPIPLLAFLAGLCRSSASLPSECSRNFCAKTLRLSRANH